MFGAGVTGRMNEVSAERVDRRSKEDMRLCHGGRNRNSGQHGDK